MTIELTNADMNSTKVKQILDYINYAKFFGIIIICIGHFLPTGSLLKAIFYSFHVPVFFIISGFLYKNCDDGFKKFIIKKINRIIVPLLLFILVTFITFIVLSPVPLLQLPEKFSFQHGQILWNEPLWFLPTMFIDSVAFAFAMKINKNHMTITALVLTVSCFILTILFNYQNISIQYLGFVRAVHMLGYVGTGFLVRRLAEHIHTKQEYDKKFVSVVSLLIFIAFCFAAGILNDGNNISVLKCDYNNIFTYIPLAIIGSVSFIYMFSAFPANKIVEVISADTIFIMSSHYFILLVFKHFFKQSFFNRLLGGLICALILSAFCIMYNYICSKYKLTQIINIGKKFGLFVR